MSTSLIRISILLLSVAHRYTQSFFLPVLCALSCALSLSLSLSSRQHSKRKTLTLCRGVSPVWCSTVHFHAHLVKELVVCVQDTHTVPILYTVYDAHMTLIDVTSLLLIPFFVQRKLRTWHSNFTLPQDEVTKNHGTLPCFLLLFFLPFVWPPFER